MPQFVWIHLYPLEGTSRRMIRSPSTHPVLYVAMCYDLVLLLLFLHVTARDAQNVILFAVAVSLRLVINAVYNHILRTTEVTHSRY